MGVNFDRANNRLLVWHTLRSRLQIYEKDGAPGPAVQPVTWRYIREVL